MVVFIVQNDTRITHYVFCVLLLLLLYIVMIKMTVLTYPVERTINVYDICMSCRSHELRLSEILQSLIQFEFQSTSAELIFYLLTSV